MHPKTKRYLIFAIVATIVIVVFLVISYYILAPMLCPPICEWVAFPPPGYCDCTPGTPVPPGLPEGIPGFHPAALLLGIIIAVLLVLLIRRHKQH